MRHRGIFVGFSSLLLTSVPSWAADYAVPADDLCAVSGVNGKIHGQGGVYDSDDSDGSQFQGVGSLSLPLGCMFGAQIDAGAGKFGDFDAFGVGGHLFTRDPTSYLIGIHTTYENWDLDDFGDNIGIWRVGPEVELYLSNISLEAWAGWQEGNDMDSSFFGRFTAAVYATENLRLAAGVRHSDDFTSGVISAEWQLSSMPLSLTAEGEIGEDDFTSIMGGVKFYFGGSSTALIDRHRHDDPADGLFDFAGAASSLSSDTPGGNECQDEVLVDGCCTDATAQDGCCTDSNVCDLTVTDGR
jgi:hypothetical protein